MKARKRNAFRIPLGFQPGQRISVIDDVQQPAARGGRPGSSWIGRDLGVDSPNRSKVAPDLKLEGVSDVFEAGRQVLHV
jgi:hypothetical protein